MKDFRSELVAALADKPPGIDRGLTPVWSCRTENKESFRLAESLGFVPVLQLPYYELPWSEYVG
jgi:hypothetical protein